MGSLDAAESLQLLRLDGNLSTKANLASGSLDEGHTVRVQRLVDRGSTRNGLDQGNASSSEGSLRGGTTLAALADILDDGSLHGKLDKVEREEPNDVPDPDDSDPTARNGTDVSEAPVSVRGDDRGNKLGDTEGNDQGDGGSLHEEESVRTGDEDESLGDNRDLKVGDHVEHAIVGNRDTRPVLEVDTKLALEEIGLQDDNDSG